VERRAIAGQPEVIRALWIAGADVAVAERSPLERAEDAVGERDPGLAVGAQRVDVGDLRLVVVGGQQRVGHGPMLVAVAQVAGRKTALDLVTPNESIAFLASIRLEP